MFVLGFSSWSLRAKPHSSAFRKNIERACSLHGARLSTSLGMSDAAIGIVLFGPNLV